jgi:tRNA U55 pseudouridine synthase TruB
VRVLAEDVGRSLGTLATLASLRRTEFGPFTVDAAEPLDRLLAPDAGLSPIGGPAGARRGPPTSGSMMRPPLRSLRGSRAVSVRLEPPASEERLGAVVAPDGRLLAVVARDGHGVAALPSAPARGRPALQTLSRMLRKFKAKMEEEQWR